MTDQDKFRLEEITQLVQSWIDQQGHDRCWYYPDIFEKIAAILIVNYTKPPALPARSEFEQGCKRYQDQEYSKNANP